MSSPYRACRGLSRACRPGLFDEVVYRLLVQGAHDSADADGGRLSLLVTPNSSAGAIWKFGTEDTGYTEYRPESGHGLVTVTPHNVLVEFIAEGGEVIDRYTVEQTRRNWIVFELKQ